MNTFSFEANKMERLAKFSRVLGTAFCLCMATPCVAQAPAAMPPMMGGSAAPAPMPPMAPSTMGGGAAPAPMPGMMPSSETMGNTAAGAVPRAAPTSWVAIPGNLFASLEKGIPTGIFVETVDALLKKTGMNPTYLNMPTGDAIRDLTTGTVSMATVVVPIPRIKDAAYFSDPVVTEYNVAVTLKDKGFSLSKVSDLRGKKIGARAGYQYPLLDKDPAIRLQRYQSDGEMLRSLLFGNVDVAIISAISDIYAFRSEGIMMRMEILTTSVGTVPLVAAFSKKHFTKESVDAFNQALATFKQSPEWQEILEKNGVADLVKDWPLVTE